MIDTQKYIKKPLYVDAVQVTEDNFDEIAAWCQGEIQETAGSKKYIKVRVHNPKIIRQTQAFVGDWLLYTERGYKVYTNKAFYASFEPLTGVAADAAVQASKPQIEAETPIEFIPATPENIAQAVQENEQARLAAEEVDSRLAAEAAGKRVLSRKEQVEMDEGELRELIRSGEVVLAQDLAV